MSDGRATPPPPAGEPIAVTGVGVVCGWGWGKEAFWQGIRSGEACIRPFARFDAGRHRTRLAAEVPPHGNGLPPAASYSDRFALGASREALAEAGLAPGALPPGAGVFFGTSTGGMFEAEAVFAAILGGAGNGDGRPPARQLRRRLLAAQPYNAPADAVARDAGASGPVFTMSSACTSASLAIAAALDALRAGETELALAGGSDSLCQLTYAGFNSLRAVDPEPCRPFRADRQGLSLGEGAAILVLETLGSARARGIRPLALLLGAGSTCDAEHMTAPAAGGAGAYRAIREALADAGLDAAGIDFVNAHGTGTPLNDAAEWEALRAVFGERAADLPVTSTKGVLGHLLGAAGAIEAAATLLCLVRGEVHPTPGTTDADPALGMRLVSERPLALPGARAALSTSLAFGGSNAALVFSRSADADADALPDRSA